MNIIIRPGLVDRTFEASDQDTSNATFSYFGFMTQDSNWVIQRFDQSVTNVINYRYASPKLNPTYVTYTAAWTAKASLNYDYFDKASI